MPPKKKFSEEDIVGTAFRLVREGGMENMTARSIAERLHSSTMPIYSCIESMEILAKKVYFAAKKKHFDYLSKENTGNAILDFYLGEILFAKEEKQLFRLLYLHPEAYHMRDEAERITNESMRADMMPHFDKVLVDNAINLAEKYKNWLFGVSCAVNFDFYFFNDPAFNNREHYIEQIRKNCHDLVDLVGQLEYKTVKNTFNDVKDRIFQLFREWLDL